MNNILKDKFNKLVFGTIAGLILTIAVFIILNSFTTLHVRKFTINGGQQSAALQNQKAIIQFNRPLDDKQPLEGIEVTPEIEFTSRITGSNLIVSFGANLDSETEYKISIPKDFKDIYGEGSKEEKILSFTTKQLSIIYLEKGEDKDKIMKVDANLENSQELYKGENILKYAKKENFLAVIKQAKGSELRELYLVNLKNKTEKKLFESTQDISHVAFAPKSDEIFVVMQQVELKDGYVVPSEGRKIEIYNTKKEEYYPFDLGGQVSDVDDLKFAPGGSSVLVKDSNNSFYYLIPISNSQSLNAVGRFVLAGGFSPKGDKIIFSNIDLADIFSEPFIILFDSNREKKQLTQKDVYSIDPMFFNKQELLAYSLRYQEKEDSRGLFKLAITDLNNKLIEEAKIEGMSLELPKPSPDDKYIVIESYTPEAQADYDHQRNFSFQAKPFDAELVVYDMSTKEFIDKDIKGIEAIWE